MKNIDEKEIINELDSIIAHCDLLKEKATGLRRKLARLNEPTSRKRGLSPEVVAKVLADREKFLNKRAEKSYEEQERATVKKLQNKKAIFSNRL